MSGTRLRNGVYGVADDLERLIRDRERPAVVRLQSIHDRERLGGVCLREDLDERAVIEKVCDAECRRNQQA